MARKQDNVSNLIDSVISKAQGTQTGEREIVDIITFCEDAKYLNFLNHDYPLELWPMQKIVLKLFYRGTEGNEDLELTQDELNILKKIETEEELDYEQEMGGFHQVVDKYNRGTLFTHMLLVMGRRSSKTMMVSIIAAYEAYKLCQAPEGNPQKKYKIGMDKPIHIMNLAVSEAQALDPLFAEIETRLARSNYFQDKINHDSSIKGKIYLLTDADKAENARRREKGMSVLLTGSVILMSGHSNSASLRGHATICVLFDEFAHFMTTTGKNSGDEVYNSMTPSMKQFGKDGKVVMLSDPRGKDGMFYKLFQMSQKRKAKADGTFEWPHDDILAVQLPTWCMNPSPELTKEILERTEKPKDPAAFQTTYGARFVGSQGSKLFDPMRIEAAIDLRMQEIRAGDPNKTFYIHLDPASTSHNYALAMVHVEAFANPNGLVRRVAVLDYMKMWTPVNGNPVPFADVEKTIRDLCRRFRVAQVTFDSFQSQQAIQNLTCSGVKSFETPFRPQYITEIYGELRTLFNEGNIVIYPHEHLIGELKEMMYKIQNRGIKRFFDPKSEYPSDDCADALAGAVYQSLHAVVSRILPKSVLVNTGRR
jgi:hypothetical protein